MDRHPGDLGQFAPHRPVNLLRRGVVPAVQDRLEHGAPLHGDRQPALAMGGLKALDSSLFLCRSHYQDD